MAGENAFFLKTRHGNRSEKTLFPLRRFTFVTDIDLKKITTFLRNMNQKDVLSQKVEYNFMFWFHLFLTMLSWFIPFLFWWPLVLTAYSIVLLQFVFFKRCLMNEGHALDDDGDFTFYAFLLEQIGFRPNRAKTRVFVRFWIYIILGTVTILWQIVLGKDHLIHFTDLFNLVG